MLGALWCAWQRPLPLPMLAYVIVVIALMLAAGHRHGPSAVLVHGLPAGDPGRRLVVAPRSDGLGADARRVWRRARHAHRSVRGVRGDPVRPAWARRPPLGVVVLGLLAYVPALTAGRGRMPADTKLYLYLDPGRLVSDAPYTFDGRQFAGWVPHQTISYLWPSGPWYWLFDTIGVPDWIAHRLWIGTILFAAGLGVRWVARLLGIVGAAAVAAAAVYQLSPYVLPYLSRTSLMLLPYAGLGWIIGLTMLAARRSTWRHAALLALVVATIGAPNATATAMIVPAPVLWLVHAAWGGEITWRRAAATAARIGGLCVAVSLWWLAMLSVQGRYGADVLAYSETLEAVSLTSTSTETLRGMGYWLFYVRDPVGFTTSAAEAYMASGRYVVTSFVLTGLGIAGLAFTRFRARRYAVLLVIAGIVLAVGVHPIDDPSLLMSPFAESSRSSFVLALRSSTRALPMAVLGLALGTGALVAATRPPAPPPPLVARPRSSSPWRPPTCRPRGTAASSIRSCRATRTRPTPGWPPRPISTEMPAGYRVMQLPGAEFGAFRWGYTVDPPLPGLTERPFVSRDLLPLGSTPAMDLLYALDDRFQARDRRAGVGGPGRPAVRRRHDLGAQRHPLRPVPQPAAGAHRVAVRQ